MQLCWKSTWGGVGTAAGWGDAASWASSMEGQLAGCSALLSRSFSAFKASCLKIYHKKHYNTILHVCHIKCIEDWFNDFTECIIKYKVLRVKVWRAEGKLTGISEHTKHWSMNLVCVIIGRCIIKHMMHTFYALHLGDQFLEEKLWSLLVLPHHTFFVAFCIFLTSPRCWILYLKSHLRQAVSYQGRSWKYKELTFSRWHFNIWI